MDLTGAQIKTALEQQWQRDAVGQRPDASVPPASACRRASPTPTTRPRPRATGSWRCGSTARRSIATTSYSVTVNSFLGSGGDNFRRLRPGVRSKRDTGKVDLQAMVDYMAEFANAAQGDAPLARRLRAARRGRQPAGRPTSSTSATQVTGGPDVPGVHRRRLTSRTPSVAVEFDGEPVGDFPVDNDDRALRCFDEYGTASVDLPGPRRCRRRVRRRHHGRRDWHQHHCAGRGQGR